MLTKKMATILNIPKNYQTKTKTSGGCASSKSCFLFLRDSRNPRLPLQEHSPCPTLVTSRRWRAGKYGFISRHGEARAALQTLLWLFNWLIVIFWKIIWNINVPKRLQFVIWFFDRISPFFYDIPNWKQL